MAIAFVTATGAILIGARKLDRASQLRSEIADNAEEH